jgi:hypothetical protein
VRSGLGHMGVQVTRDKPQDSLSVRERDNASARQRFSILRRGQVTMGRRVTDRPSRARASLPQLERHPGAYPGPPPTARSAMLGTAS